MVQPRASLAVVAECLKASCGLNKSPKEGEADPFELSLPSMPRYNWQTGNGYV